MRDSSSSFRCRRARSSTRRVGLLGRAEGEELPARRPEPLAAACCSSRSRWISFKISLQGARTEVRGVLCRFSRCPGLGGLLPKELTRKGAPVYLAKVTFPSEERKRWKKSGVMCKERSCKPPRSSTIFLPQVRLGIFRKSFDLISFDISKSICNNQNFKYSSVILGYILNPQENREQFQHAHTAPAFAFGKKLIEKWPHICNSPPLYFTSVVIGKGVDSSFV